MLLVDHRLSATCGVEAPSGEREPTHDLLATATMLSKGIADHVLDALVDPLFVIDLQGRLLRWNERARLVTGYAESELCGMDVGELFAAEDAVRVEAAIETAYREGRVLVEVDIKTRDGQCIPFELSGAVLRDEDGEVAGLCGVGRDLTERKRSEQRLRESEQRAQRLALLASRTSNGVLFTDAEGRIQWVNEGFTRLSGYRPDEAVGRRPSDLLRGPDTDPEVHAFMQQRLGNREGCTVELLNYGRSGQTYWARVELQPLFDDGVFTGFLGLQTDITAQKETEAALREREALLEAVADAMGTLLTEEPDAAINQVFERLGRATGADRVYLFEAHEEPETGTLMVSQRYEWSCETVISQADNPALQNLPVDMGFARWHRILRDGGIVTGRVDEMPADEQPLLEAQGVRSVLAVPIHFDGHLWGFVGFDDCHEARVWSGAEQATLTAAAGAIGKAISQQRDRQALRRNEERFRQLLQNSSDVISILAPDGTIQYHGPSLRHVLGYEPDELQSQSAFDYVHPDDRPRLRAQVARLAQYPGATAIVAFRWRHADGRWMWLEAIGTNLLNEPSIGGILVNSRDVTARKVAEDALRQGEQKYRTLFEQAGDAILIFEPDDETILEANERACQLYGYSREDLVGRSIKSFSTDVARGEEKLGEVLNEGLLNNYVTVQRRKDGTPLHLVISASLIDYEGRTVVMSLNRDVTAHREAERALQESERKYRNVVENMRDVVFRTDAEGRWTYVNPAWTRITGFEAEEILGVSFFECVHPDDRARSAEEFERLVGQQKPFCRHEVRCRAKGGGYRWVEVYATLQRDEGGHAVGTVGMLHDVGERKQAMEALERALERERELGLLKSRFVSMASHELRTPLTAIRTSAELLHRFGERWQPERRQVLFDRILGNTEVMNELIEDVLLLGRVETGRLAFAPERLELKAWCEALVQEVREGIGARHRWRVGLPDVPVHAEVDPKLLRHIVANLLSNAVKYAPEDSTIDLQLVGSDEAVRLVVVDEGIGIPEAEVPHLFEPFRRASNVGSRSGTGLGLAIARRALDLHDGSIGVESILGAGTTFTVTLPTTSQASAARSSGRHEEAVA